MMVNKIIALTLAAACIFSIHCGEDGPTDSGDNVHNTDYVARETFAYKVPLAAQSTLRLEAINGNVDVTGVSQADSVVIAGEKRVGSDSMADAEEHLEQLDVQVQDSATEIFVETVQPEETHGRSYVVDYAVTLPPDFQVVIGNVNGSVTVDSIADLVSVNNVNGLVALDEISGSVYVILVNGQIESEVTLPLNGTITMATANGVIELQIPESTSAEFSASVGNGTISVSNLNFTNQVSSSNTLSGTLGQGQGTITLSAGNGNIIVSGF